MCPVSKRDTVEGMTQPDPHRAEPTIRRKLIEALLQADNEKTQKDTAREMGKAYGYANSLLVMAGVEGYVPVAGITASIHSLDHPDSNLERVQRFMGKTEGRIILGLDAEVMV